MKKRILKLLKTQNKSKVRKYWDEKCIQKICNVWEFLKLHYLEEERKCLQK